MNTYSQEPCWLCGTPASSCDCEIFDSTWSRSTSQGSFLEEQATFDMNEVAFCTIDRSHFIPGAFENPDLEINDMIPYFGRGPCPTSTPKNNDDAGVMWVPYSPDTALPPESSSPAGLGADSSPFFTDRPALRLDLQNVDRAVLCRAHDNGPGQYHVKALFNPPVDSNAFIFPPTTSMGRVSPPPLDSSIPMDERLRTDNERDNAADMLDVCVENTQMDGQRTIDIHKADERVATSGSRASIPCKRGIRAVPTVLDLGTSTDVESMLSRGSQDHGSNHVTVTRDDGDSSKVFVRQVCEIAASCLSQARTNSRLKRRCSSTDDFPELKKARLDRTMSHISCVSDASFKYEAKEPASQRRAQSLISEASLCSKELTDSLFYPSPLSASTPRSHLDKDYAPTLPSTPLPNSVDYARSKANPLVRTLVVYRRRSLDVPAIPPVPIIAPPIDLTPTVVRCPEDEAIERLKALLARERSERERDGLSFHDEKRLDWLKAVYRKEPSISRRDSSSSSDSSEVVSDWEEESTRSTIDFQEGRPLAASVKIQMLEEQHRLANRDLWSNAFGIANDFRRDVTRWILEKLPKEPYNRCEDGRPLGLDLHDQLVNSPQTRFHASQLFHRYFRLPEKVQYWREMDKCERFERDFCGSQDESEYERCVWQLAVACMALSVKLHRDCLSPLRPVFASEFLEMAPHPMTHETFELTQRDVLYSFHFQLGSCTPQDVLDELWNALPTLRHATVPVGWTTVQGMTWERLFESLLAPDILRYPVTLLTAAALVDSLTFALASQYRVEAEPTKACHCVAQPKMLVSEPFLDDVEEMAWRIHLHDASKLVNDVILDVKDVLQISIMELDECRKWMMSYVDRV